MRNIDDVMVLCNSRVRCMLVADKSRDKNRGRVARSKFRGLLKVTASWRVLTFFKSATVGVPIWWVSWHHHSSRKVPCC